MSCSMYGVRSWCRFTLLTHIQGTVQYPGTVYTLPTQRDVRYNNNFFVTASLCSHFSTWVMRMKCVLISPIANLFWS